MNRLLATSLLLIATATMHAQVATTSFVDPRIGTGDHGHVFVGANVPFGMVNAGPTQLETGWDWCSGYHESGTKIVGFAQTHLSGTGCSDLGDVAIMPATTRPELTREGLATPFSHDDEDVRPGYYSVLLPASGIRTEITADCRNAMYRISYPKGASENLIVVDLANGVGDHMRQARLTPVNDSTFVGFRISHGWANEQHCYFAIRCSRPAAGMDIKASERGYYQLSFEPSDEPLIVTISLSPVSEFNAQQNMVSPAMTFDEMRRQADEQWNRNLGRIQATFRSERDRRIFYTAMYHFMVAPQTWDDANGDWRGADNKVYRNGQWTMSINHYLTTLSLWDTYRAAAPLSTIILPEMMPSVAETYLRIFREQGKLPVWHLMSQETNCMVGCPAVPILADLLLKGYAKDTLTAVKAMTHSLIMDERGLDDMKKYGYVCNDHHGGSLSMTLEYMLADWSVAQALKAAKGLPAAKADDLTMGGFPDIDQAIRYFDKRAHSYHQLYDPRVGYLRSKNSHGEFNSIEGFNPAHQTADYTEGNPWQYLWLVPHDVEGLAELLGGRERARQRLDSLFAASSELNADANPDITGLIGQYAHGNEPSHHIAYLYALLGQPRKTAAIVRQIMRELYTDQPAGLCGNEDVGQMSAWYILSALGFYQVEPCGGRYVIGSPLVEEATLHVGQGRTFRIRTHANSSRNIHVKRALLNGRPLPADGPNGALILHHADIVRGGTLDLYMGK